MADDKKIIFSMVGVSKMFPPHKQVLKDIYLSFFYGAKIGIIGLNGSGKSTLLKIIAGVEKSYQGEVVFSPGYSVGYLEQEPKLDPEKTVKEVVQEGVQPILDLLAEYEKVNESFGDPDVLENPDKMEALIARQAELQDHIDASDAWNIDNKLERAMDALRCPPEDQLVKFLSGGERRRVALCRLLLQQPDILLLDEPTNHLDAESIDWLEQHLQQYPGTVIAITHDRYFLDHVAGWILPTTSMPSRSIGWNSICSNIPVRLLPLPTTVISSTTWPGGFSNSIGAKVFPGREIIPRGWNRKPNVWRWRRNRRASGVRLSNGNWNGFVWLPKPDSRKVKPA